ncbi:unnamed protein product, partial [Mesorhabditis belari]|uniref:Uncharacterized protein n=1 Tax=Mesorhabditis belari TaxID=2138241 RepID=A0AAF3EQA7_9BILA
MNFLLPYSFLFEIGLTAFLSHLHFHILQDLILHYVILFRIRLPTWGVHEWYWFLRTGFFPSALGYLNGLCVQLQVIGTLLIAINRATSLAFPHHYDKDLLMHYSLLFRIRLPTWGVYEFFWNVQEGVIPAILAVGYMFSVLFQELGTLLIAINRATSLTFPQHYEWVSFRLAFLLLISEETRMIVTGKLKGRDGVHTKTAVSTISMQNSPRLLQSSMLMANAKSTNPGLNHSKTTSNMYGNA